MDAYAALPNNRIKHLVVSYPSKEFPYTTFGGLFSQTPLGDDPFVHPIRKQAGASHCRARRQPERISFIAYEDMEPIIR